jgi:hypothetical protein
MQLILSFLERAPPQKQRNVKIGAEARIAAIKILARMIAQAAEVARQGATTNE